MLNTNFNTSPPTITIRDRLENGNLSIEEVCALADRSKTGFYADLKAGRVSIRKVGRRSVVSGPVAKAYISGEQRTSTPSNGEA
ncbi:MAG: hypothetical protein WDN46_24820 [Methylocella sp.]